MTEHKNTEYLNKKQLCKKLNISPHTAQKELSRAIKENSGAVIKIGKCLRIDFDKFIYWNNNKNINELKNMEEVEWEKKETKIQKDFIKEEIYGGFIIPKEEYNIASQLRQRIFKTQ